MPLSGHLWTLAPRLAHAAWPRPLPPSVPWSAVVDDPLVGEVRLTGRLHEVAGARTLVILLHGLGGSAASHYLCAATLPIVAAGHSCLRLNLRGADGSGEDLYHAGLTTDLAAAIASRELAGYERLFVLGFSLGGHLALRYATETPERRVIAVAAVCSPIDLDRGAAAIDRPGAALYRGYILRHLRSAYAKVAERRPLSMPAVDLRRVARLREFDSLTVVPRFGFANVSDYYARASVAPRLPQLSLPALLVATRHDPMVPAGSIGVALAESASPLEVVWSERGGHVGFPADIDLGLPGKPGLVPQILGWFERADSWRTARGALSSTARP